MDISVIIVNWNTKALLHDCLVSILEQAGDVDYEIIVVDNCSSDGSQEMVKVDFLQATLIENGENRGYAAGCNSGIRIAKGKYVLILNSDILICDSAIKKTFEYAEIHSEAAVIGCQVRKNFDNPQMTCFRFPSLLNLFLRVTGLAAIFKNNRFFGREDMRWWQRDTDCEIDVVSGMFMLVRQKAIEEIGLMDEDYFMYCEETDWCYRFKQAGWKMMFWPGAYVIHLDGGGHSNKTDNLKLRIQMQKSILMFYEKHYGTLSYYIARLLLVIYFGLKYIGLTLLSLGRRLAGKNVICESTEKEKRWSVLKYLALGLESKIDQVNP